MFYIRCYSNMSDFRNQDWEQIWQQYVKSLESWKEMFVLLQKASEELQDSFNKVWEKAADGTSPETFKNFGDVWQEAMKQIENNPFQQFSEKWQNAMSSATAESFKQFSEMWQKNLSESGMNQLQLYGDMMKKFAETWNAMWPQK